MKPIKELPQSTTRVRNTWSGEVIHTLRSNPGKAYEILTGPRKLVMSRAAYLRRFDDMDVRTVLNDEKTECTIYASADGTIKPD